MQQCGADWRLGVYYYNLEIKKLKFILALSVGRSVRRKQIARITRLLAYGLIKNWFSVGSIKELNGHEYNVTLKEIWCTVWCCTWKNATHVLKKGVHTCYALTFSWWQMNLLDTFLSHLKKNWRFCRCCLSQLWYMSQCVTVYHYVND